MQSLDPNGSATRCGVQQWRWVAPRLFTKLGRWQCSNHSGVTLADAKTFHLGGPHAALPTTYLFESSVMFNLICRQQLQLPVTGLDVCSARHPHLTMTVLNLKVTTYVHRDRTCRQSTHTWHDPTWRKCVACIVI